MKVQPTPTSPKARAGQKAEELGSLYGASVPQPFLRPHRQRVVSLQTVVISVAISALAGTIGGMLYQVYLNDVVVSETPSPFVKRPREQSGTFSVSEIRKMTLSLHPSRRSDQQGIAYASEEQRGTALLLSSDGWAVTTKDVIGDGDTVAVTFDQKIFRVEERVADPATDLVYFRISGSRHAIASFEEFEATPGMQVSVVRTGIAEETVALQTAAIASVRAPRDESKAEEESDAFGRVIALSATLPDNFLGSPVVSETGKILGVVRSVSEGVAVWPSSVITDILETLLSQKTLIRSSLSIQYVDLALTPGVIDTQRFDRFQGALVTRKEPATSNKSIQVGDIIVAVGEQTLNARLGLHEALQRVKPDSVVSITLVRDGTEQKIPVTPDAITATP